jgi:hypothetical protein
MKCVSMRVCCDAEATGLPTGSAGAGDGHMIAADSLCTIARKRARCSRNKQNNELTARLHLRLQKANVGRAGCVPVCVYACMHVRVRV